MEYKNTQITYKNAGIACEKYKDHNVFFIIDGNVNVDDILFYFENYHSYTLLVSEQNKSLAKYNEIVSLLTLYSYSKDDYIIAIGGGITLDLAGFVAATYKRGINLVLVPTTLLAMTDAAIGGKCALNYSNIKNALGTMYDPVEVVIDPLLLGSLPVEEFNNGLCEMLKMGVTLNKDILPLLKNNINEAIKACIESKCKMVLEDYYDKHDRHVLNFGHTIGHAIELLNPDFKHGFAIGCGMLFFIDDKKVREQVYGELSLLFNVDYYLDFVRSHIYDILDNVTQDKKVRIGDVECIILDDYCKYHFETLPIEKIEERIRRYFNV